MQSEPADAQLPAQWITAAKYLTSFSAGWSENTASKLWHWKESSALKKKKNKPDLKKETLALKHFVMLPLKKVRQQLKNFFFQRQCNFFSQYSLWSNVSVSFLHLKFFSAEIKPQS